MLIFVFSDLSYCDFPDNSTCEVDKDDFQLLAPKETKLIYLTFDDGPWIGTAEVIEVLEKNNVKVIMERGTYVYYFLPMQCTRITYDT